MSVPNIYNSKPVVQGYTPLKFDNTSVRIQNSAIKNQNYQSYKVLRDQIIDKVQDLVISLDNPHSSLNQFVKLLRNRYGSLPAKKITTIMDNLLQNTDKILSTNGQDNEAFFEEMRLLTQNMNNLQVAIIPYTTNSDTMDELNPIDANYSLIRLINDFQMLDKAESGFPKNFRTIYANDMLKQ